MRLKSDQDHVVLSERFKIKKGGSQGVTSAQFGSISVLFAVRRMR